MKPCWSTAPLARASTPWGTSSGRRTLLTRSASWRRASAPPCCSNGESGTGKGWVARMIHDLSPRTKAPFVEVNCGGLQRPFLDSELFGHEKGAFTDAKDRKQGLFEIADHGTIFLDEIGIWPLSSAQVVEGAGDQNLPPPGRDPRDHGGCAAGGGHQQQSPAKSRPADSGKTCTTV